MRVYKCQQELESTLQKNLTDVGNFNIGFPGGSFNKKVHYNEKIWVSTFEMNGEETTPRFWNGFGLSNGLDAKKSNNIVVEINIPTNGINRRVSGFFAKDNLGNTCLFHRGGIGGGRKGIGKEAFLNWSSYKLTEVLTEDKKESAILIGNVSDKSFIDSLEDFLKNISKFKVFATSEDSDEASYLSQEELLERILANQQELRNPKSTQISTQSFERSSFVKAYALQRANGKCQLCKCNAPFKNKYGQPHLEVHHIKWLAENGSDTPENVVALCPNCHRKMHIVNDFEDISELKQTASEN